MFYRIFLNFIFFIVLSFVCQTAQAKVVRLSPNEGLAQSYVSNLIVDKKGYLWLATQGGLNKYDGYQVEAVLGPDNVLADAIIDVIYQDNQGYIWITSLLIGVFRYDPDTAEFKQFVKAPTNENEVSNKAVFSVLDSGHSGTIWLGRGRDLAKLNMHTGKIEPVFNIPNATIQSAVRQLFYHQGFIYIGTTEGAYIYEIASGRTRVLNHLQSTEIHVDQNNVKSFALKDQNTLWVGAVKGLYQVDISNAQSLFEEPQVSFKSTTYIANLNIWKIYQKQNNLKLATDKGVFEYYPEDNHLVKNNSLADSEYTQSDVSIIDMIEDQHGSMWLATKTDGAFFVPNVDYFFFNYHPDNVKGQGLTHHNVWDIVEFKKKLWLGTANGLTQLDVESYQTEGYLKDYIIDEYNKKFSIFKLLPYKKDLWLQTSRGLFKFDTVSKEITPAKTTSKEFEKYLVDRVYGIYANSEGDLYGIHPDHGMFKYNLNTLSITPLNKGFESIDPFLAIGFLEPLADKPNFPLFYASGTLYRYDIKNESLEVIYQLHKKDTADININSYAVDKNGVLWLSFNTLGLIGLDVKTFKEVHRIDRKFIGSLLYDMFVDDIGIIWMSSHKGIWRLDPDNLHFQQYTVEDGLEVNEFNGSTGTKLSNGRIAYGSVKGITVFTPSDNRPKQALIEQVNITSVQLMSRKLDIPATAQVNEIALNHDDIGLDIAFSAMAFKYQDRIKFEYQLSDGKKVTTRNTNRVMFPKLNAGKYTLSVRAKDPLTGIYTKPATLKINVAYAPWRSPYALITYAFIIFSVIFVWLSRRNKMQRKLLIAHKETQQSEARLKLALQASHSGVWDWHTDSALIYQPRLITDLGYENEKISLDDYLKKIHPEDRAKFRIEWLEFLSTNKGAFECTYRIRHIAGHWRWYKDLGKVMVWDNGQPINVSGTYTNITRELVFEESARLFGAAFEHTRDWVFILDKKFRVRATNQAVRDDFNLSKNIVSSRKLDLGLSKNTRLNYLRILAKLKPSEHFQFDEIIITPDKVKHPVIIKVTAIADETNQNNSIENYIVVITDISEQKEAENELRVLANYDSLTKLPNRSLLLDRISHATELARRHENTLALIFIDLDRFKQVNDSLGHDYGDELLVEIANRLKLALREQDTVARLGGDEFVILLEDIDLVDEVLTVCNKLAQDISKPVKLGLQKVSVGSSMGIAMFPEDADETNDLLKAADIAMFHAKKHSSDSYQFFRQEMNHKIQRKLQLESDLKLAFEDDKFINYYQPIICVITQKTLGFEVLLRWPDNGRMVSPSEFIPAAESTGLIKKITLATLQRALKDLSDWLTVLPECYLSVNLSAKDFENPQLFSCISSLINEYDIKPKHLVFEITETVLMHDSEKALECMQQLKSFGCKIYLDDFGTGYSSLTYLKKFPIDVLKIDQSFVKDIGVDTNDETIINSTLAMAHSLGKECVAEGVENFEQVQFLEMLGCSYLQGFLFSKPVPSEGVVALLSKDWGKEFEP